MLKDKQRVTRETKGRGYSHQGQQNMQKQHGRKRLRSGVFREQQCDWRSEDVRGGSGSVEARVRPTHSMQMGA